MWGGEQASCPLVQVRTPLRRGDISLCMHMPHAGVWKRSCHASLFDTAMIQVSGFVLVWVLIALAFSIGGDYVWDALS